MNVFRPILIIFFMYVGPQVKATSVNSIDQRSGGLLSLSGGLTCLWIAHEFFSLAQNTDLTEKKGMTQAACHLVDDQLHTLPMSHTRLQFAHESCSPCPLALHQAANRNCLTMFEEGRSGECCLDFSLDAGSVVNINQFVTSSEDKPTDCCQVAQPHFVDICDQNNQCRFYQENGPYCAVSSDTRKGYIEHNASLRFVEYNVEVSPDHPSHDKNLICAQSSNCHSHETKIQCLERLQEQWGGACYYLPFGDPCITLEMVNPSMNTPLVCWSGITLTLGVGFLFTSLQKLRLLSTR